MFSFSTLSSFMNLDCYGFDSLGFAKAYIIASIFLYLRFTPLGDFLTGDSIV